MDNPSLRSGVVWGLARLGSTLGIGLVGWLALSVLLPVVPDGPSRAQMLAAWWLFAAVFGALGLLVAVLAYVTDVTTWRHFRRARAYLGEGHREIAPGVHRSADNRRQVRVTRDRIHLERLDDDGQTVTESTRVR